MEVEVWKWGANSKDRIGTAEDFNYCGLCGCMVG